jgi:KUP system potassium uptake protein
MGHFGKTPIRIAWLAVAMPASSTTARRVVLADPQRRAALRAGTQRRDDGPGRAVDRGHHQSCSSGAFSYAPATLLGYFPRVSIRTRAHRGDLYPADQLLLVLAVLLVLGFHTSARLAAAYGTRHGHDGADVVVYFVTKYMHWPTT